MTTPAPSSSAKTSLVEKVQTPNTNAVASANAMAAPSANAMAAPPANAMAAPPAPSVSSRTRHCIQKGPVECIAGIKNSIKAVPATVLHLAEGAVTGAVREVKHCGTGLPHVMSGVAHGVRDTVYTMQKGVVDLADTLANVKVGNVLHANAIYKAYLLAVNGLQQKIDRFFLGDMAGKDVDTTQLLQHIRKTSEKFKNLAKNPKFRKVLREMTDNYSQAVVGSLNAAQPGIDRVTTKAKGIINDTGTRLGSTLGNAASNAIKAVIGEIPAVGGIITGVISIGDLTNKLIDTCLPPAKFLVDVGTPLVNGALDTADDIKCKLLELQKKTAGLMQEVEDDGDGQQTGGGVSMVRSKLKQSTRRLQRLFKTVAEGTQGYARKRKRLHHCNVTYKKKVRN